MKNLIIGILITIVAFIGYTQFSQEGVFGSVETNDLGYNGFTQSATSTSADPIPVTVLEANSARQYARICNNSDTVIWLTLGATSTEDDLITVNQGIQLNTVGLTDSCWEITPNNLFIGNIHATTTASAKEMVYTEK